MLTYAGTEQKSRYYVIDTALGEKVVQAKTEQEACAKAFNYIAKNLHKFSIDDIKGIKIICDKD